MSVRAAGNDLFTPSAAMAGDPAHLEEGEKSMPHRPPLVAVDSVESWRQRASKRASYTSAVSTKGVQVREQPVWANSRSASSLSHLAALSSRGPYDRQSRLNALWTTHRANPRNWSPLRKGYHAFAVFLASFAIGVGAGIVLPAQKHASEQYGLSPVLSALPLALYLLGLAAAPFLLPPCSRLAGRKVQYVTSLLLWTVFTIGASFVRSFVAIAINRLLAGIAGSVPFALGHAVICDLWSTEQRASPLALMKLAQVLGPVTGLAIGGPIAQENRPWQWSQYVLLCFGGAALIFIVTISETYRETIAGRRQSSQEKFSAATKALGDAVTGMFGGLATRPVILVVSLYTGLAVASMYTVMENIFPALAETHRLSLGLRGVAFLTMLTGLLLALAAVLLDHIFIYRPRLTRWRAVEGAGPQHIIVTNEKSNRLRRRSRRISYANKRLSRSDSQTTSIKGLTANASVESLPTPDRQAEVEKNRHFSVVIATYLDCIPANRGRGVTPGRVLAVLEESSAFGVMCEGLRAQGFEFDRSLLAKVVVDAMSSVPATVRPRDYSSASISHARAGSRTHSPAPAVPPPVAQRNSSGARPGAHESATLAALESSSTTAPAPPSTKKQRYAAVARVRQQSMPPPEWRLILALPASVLLPGALFMLAWTTAPGLPKVLPLVALGVFAAALCLVLATFTQYMAERYRSSPRDRDGALSAALFTQLTLSFAFVLLADTLAANLGIAWGTSVLGILTAVFGLVPWLCFFPFRKSRRIGGGSGGGEHG